MISMNETGRKRFRKNDVDGIIHTVYYTINFFYTLYLIWWLVLQSFRTRGRRGLD
jgi:hypothetical protein